LHEVDEAISEAGLDEIPVVLPCPSCGDHRSLPLARLRPGTVLRCPVCGITEVPTQQMYLMVRRRLERLAAEQSAAKASARDALRSRADADIEATMARLVAPRRRKFLGLG
jgi:uncharacterized Zn finger protein (UPF0148 family)